MKQFLTHRRDGLTTLFMILRLYLFWHGSNQSLLPARGLSVGEAQGVEVAP